MLAPNEKKSMSLPRPSHSVSRNYSKETKRFGDMLMNITKPRRSEMLGTSLAQNPSLSRPRLPTTSVSSITRTKPASTSKTKSMRVFPPRVPSITEKLLLAKPTQTKDTVVTRLNTMNWVSKRASVETKSKTPSQKFCSPDPPVSPPSLANFFKAIKIKKKTDASPKKSPLTLPLSKLEGFVTKVAEPGPEQPPSSFRAGNFEVEKAKSRPYFIEDLVRSHSSDSSNYFAQIFKSHFSQTLQTLSLMLSLDLKKYRPNGLECMISDNPQNGASSTNNFITNANFGRDLLGQSSMNSDTNSKVSSENAKVKLARSFPRKKTLIFDLDETLIHCSEDQAGVCDARIPITFPNGEHISAGINIRPYATELLNEMSRIFEVIVFTASHSCYANPVIDYIDPNRVVSHRLFRENCSIITEGLYTKDLTVIKNRSLKDMILVDNANYSFFLQMSNGVPIIPFYDNKEDRELLKLKEFLIPLAQVEDVRDHISEYFKWPMFRKYVADPMKLIQSILS